MQALSPPAHGLTLPLPSWAPPEAAQVLRLDAVQPVPRGHVVYPPAFDVVAATASVIRHRTMS